MTATTKPPTLPDPGFGRRWEWEQVATNPMRPRSKTWFASLWSRQGTLLGYIGEYPEFGWSGTIKARRKTVGAGVVPGVAVLHVGHSWRGAVTFAVAHGWVHR